MRSMFSIEEIGEMLNMKPSEVESELENGNLGFTYEEGEKMVTLYDLEKYMGAEQTRSIIREFMSNKQE